MKVIVLPKVLDYFEELVIILYEKEYFSFLDTSQKYIDELFDEIKEFLPTRVHKSAPIYFDKYGKDMEYAVFKKSKRTSWYVFFRTYRENGEDVYQVRYIANNHLIAQHL